MTKRKKKVDVHDIYASNEVQEQVQQFYHDSFSEEDVAKAIANGDITKLNSKGDKLITASLEEVMQLSNDAKANVDAEGDPQDSRIAQIGNETVVDNRDFSSVNEGGPDETDEEEKPDPYPDVNPDASMPTQVTIKDPETGEMRPATLGEIQEIAKSALYAEIANKPVDDDTPEWNYFLSHGENVPAYQIGGIKPFNGPNGSQIYAVKKENLEDWRKIANIGPGGLVPCDSDGFPIAA